MCAFTALSHVFQKINGVIQMYLRRLKDIVSGLLLQVVAVLSSIIILFIAILLYWRAKPILDTKSLSELFLGMHWMPSQGDFGFLPSILGTLYVTMLAMIIAIPLSVLSAIYIAEYAKESVRSKILPLVDLLAGIPPVVYGVWGVLVVVPTVAYIAPIIGKLGIIGVSNYSTGFSLLSGGIVLAIMVFPIIISITVQVLKTVPFEVREASFSLGATRWQTIKHAVMRLALPGIVAAIILGFSRAFGETMAVLMVVGNVFSIPTSIFGPAYPLTALIANNYGEMMSIPLYDSALLLAALILMFVILSSTVVARLVLIRLEKRMIYG